MQNHRIPRTKEIRNDLLRSKKEQIKHSAHRDSSRWVQNQTKSSRVLSLYLWFYVHVKDAYRHQLYTTFHGFIVINTICTSFTHRSMFICTTIHSIGSWTMVSSCINFALSWRGEIPIWWPWMNRIWILRNTQKNYRNILYIWDIWKFNLEIDLFGHCKISITWMKIMVIYQFGGSFMF